MRIVQKILGGIGVLTALLLLLVLICYLNPDVSTSLGNIVQKFVPVESDSNRAEEPILTSNQTNQIQTLNPTADSLTDTEDTLDTSLEGIVPTTLEVPYEAPDDDSLSIASDVASLTGLEPITSSGEAIPSAEVTKLENTLSVGETGDGLTFDETMYPYYNMLNDEGKTLYRQIYANMDAVFAVFKPVITTDAALLKNTFSAVCNDQPQLFWINTGYGFKYGSDGKIAEIDLQFNNLTSNLDAAKSTFNSSADEILAGARNLNSNYEKEVYLHDALMDKNTYVLNAPLNQSAYSALVNGKTVCAGYARAMQYLCMQLNIPCYYCTGYAGENHAWNIVELEDEYYNADVTWDDTDPNTHDYFNCTDAEYAKDHARKELSIYLPPCLGEKYGDLIIDEPVQTAPEETEEAIEPETIDVQPVEEVTPESESSTEETETVEEETTEENPYADTDLTAVVNNLEDYFTVCKANILDNETKDTMEFDITIKNRALWEDIYLTYRNGGQDQGYVNEMLEKLGKETCTVEITAERQTGGKYIISHKVIFS